MSLHVCFFVCVCLSLQMHTGVFVCVCRVPYSLSAVLRAAGHPSAGERVPAAVLRGPAGGAATRGEHTPLGQSHDCKTRLGHTHHQRQHRPQTHIQHHKGTDTCLRQLRRQTHTHTHTHTLITPHSPVSLLLAYLLTNPNLTTSSSTYYIYI